MPKFELLYFTGCPILPRARAALKAAGVLTVTDVNQDSLLASDPKKNYSSPTILADGALIIGLRGHPSACTVADWDEAIKTLSIRNR